MNTKSIFILMHNYLSMLTLLFSLNSLYNYIHHILVLFRNLIITM